MSGADMIDWGLATSTAQRMLRPGPQIDAAAAAEVVVDLRMLAGDAEGHVRAFTGMVPPPEAPPVAVVDRGGWVRSNVEGFRTVLTPLVGKLTAKHPTPSPLVAGVGRRVTGVQVGTVLAYLASRVLGQYEIFLPPEHGLGRLLLVAPNIVATERSLGVDPHDFRLWVCLHEVTHRTQFTAVPWLREHVHGEISELVEISELDPAALLDRLRGALGGLGAALLGRSEQSVLELIQTPAQRAVMDRLQAFMSLVEGHAEYVMDGVGPEVVPTLAVVRSRFDVRRGGAGPFDRVVRRLLGIDLKMRQYAEGARFVRGVVERAGMAGFNQVWTGPATLPTKTEITDPGAWVERVLGETPAATA